MTEFRGDAEETQAGERERSNRGMFVRWQTRRKRWGEAALRCYLCSSRRCGGKVVQSSRYLGSVRAEDACDTGNFSVRDNFWRRVDAALESLAPNDRQKLVHAIESRVPRPTSADKERLERELSELAEEFAAKMSRPAV